MIKCLESRKWLGERLMEKMSFDFCGITFDWIGDDLGAVLGGNKTVFGISDVRLSGADIEEQTLSRQVGSGISNGFKFVKKVQTPRKLEIFRDNGKILAVTVFEKKGGGIRVYTRVKNLTDKKITLENVSAFTLGAFGAECPRKELYLYRFFNSHHTECQPKRLSFDDLGLFNADHRTYKRIFGVNAGSWTCKEELPQAIIENAKTGEFLMFQIESCGAWYWEIGDSGKSCYLTLSGGNREHTQWRKKLGAGKSYITPSVGICLGRSLNDLLANMTKYRRSVSEFSKRFSDVAVFNEYMHFSWDSPDEKRTERMLPIVKKAGADYYVIDCGWHDEEDGDKIYPYVGKWKESKRRFPHGVRHMTDLIRSNGMKAGLWIEPEIVGKLSGVEYPEEGYISEGGERVLAANRYFLDFRCPEVRIKMSEAISRMVYEYGADYIKIDCNQDSGAGTEKRSDSPGDGLEKTTGAFWKWLKEERKKYPQVLFESCASGGQRMDWKSLSVSPMISTSDQVLYNRYPYIVGNIFSAVLPEQAGFWSYPYCSLSFLNIITESEENPTPHETVMNMVNSILGRLHLASDLSKLPESMFDLVKEGVAYGKSLAQFREKAVPFLPFGFTSFGEQVVSVGLKKGKRLVLAVWNLGLACEMEVPLCGLKVKEIEVGYPSCLPVAYEVTQTGIAFKFEEMQVFVLDIQLK